MTRLYNPAPKRPIYDGSLAVVYTDDNGRYLIQSIGICCRELAMQWDKTKVEMAIHRGEERFVFRINGCWVRSCPLCGAKLEVVFL